MPDFQNRYYFVAEIATTLGVSTRTIHRLIHDLDDPLPAYRLRAGGPLHVRGADLNKYLTDHQVNPLEE